MQNSTNAAANDRSGIDGPKSFRPMPSAAGEGSGVWGFFYGGLINPAVMRRVGLSPSERRLAVLLDYDITIAPWVNLVPCPGALAYGLLLKVQHEELARVYAQLKVTYFPMPVIVHQLDGLLRPALCYMVPTMDEGQAEAAHIEPLLETGEELGFPEWYLDKIRSFMPSA